MKTTTAVRSTAISSCTYDDATNELIVTFTNGRSYTHADVPQEVYQGLVMSSSPGSFYNSSIRGVYV
jgi:hypothetical protein